ncbi:acetyl-CoA carboxylase, carboxyltransferase subunit beta [Paremcibacter congregatus]|uniref:Acetyl-coenzyme A carboxylase carboxyl transferase subunit beta n=1 Tax=Paremcibacter congregatus TaxID=2043170 RepID=A0A2G4YNR1_9PROT|nr:acetyl-CoA carboxylase, carboxyltransferase subunit beta [Paremcibacter congregatus]PHZ83950.1 acetyl-CoA carboxylase carboxyl transferase subunit beta [Paremcibacter congregatus]QDE25959.1 acetyl-CoA carboxylase carboxyltransferase subunit beta [Paremcibacter congregatus]|tara:strand:+ start:3732 stop:4595 length:864 start_codon:yes stop_codon:yes gene_type:complete
MNWITNFVRPKIRAVLENKKETPDNLWHKCKGCGQLLYLKDYLEVQSVCSHCGFHGRIDPVTRFKTTFNDGEYTLIDVPKPVEDPLKFRDQKRYTDRLKAARAKSDFDDAMAVAYGKVGTVNAVLAVQSFLFMGGSMGMAVGNGIVAAAETAVAKKAPLVLFAAAGGARMQEGILSLMQMPRTTVAVEMVKDAGLPYIVVLTDPTTGGVTASYAMLGDVQIAEPNALICFAGPRVIKDTIREELPEGFQKSEYLFEHGMVDMIVHRHEMRDNLINLLSLLMKQPKAA